MIYFLKTMFMFAAMFQLSTLPKKQKEERVGFCVAFAIAVGVMYALISGQGDSN